MPRPNIGAKTQIKGYIQTTGLEISCKLAVHHNQGKKKRISLPTPKLFIRYRILSPDVICFVLQNNEFWLGFLEMATLSIRIGISEAKHCHPEDENSYLTSSCNPRKHWILATLWDPLIPDPAFDRHFASYWMDQLQSESSIQKNGEKSNFLSIFLVKMLLLSVSKTLQFDGKILLLSCQ